MKKISMLRGDLVFLVVVVFMAGFILGTSLMPANVYTRTIGDEKTVEMLLPAVDRDGNGVVARLYTTVKPGTGKILLDTADVLNYLDTQLSGRTAARVAAKIAKVDLSSVDVVYTIKVNASIVEGPSAGAAMALSALLAMENKTADSIAITGTINPDGTIGSVGSVPQKARAAKEAGSKIFLVPTGQLTSEDSKRTKTCSFLGSVQVCKISYTAESVDLSSALNMTVYEVADVTEAYSYFNRTG